MSPPRKPFPVCYSSRWAYGCFWLDATGLVCVPGDNLFCILAVGGRKIPKFALTGGFGTTWDGQLLHPLLNSEVGKIALIETNMLESRFAESGVWKSTNLAATLTLRWKNKPDKRNSKRTPSNGGRVNWHPPAWPYQKHPIDCGLLLYCLPLAFLFIPLAFADAKLLSHCYEKLFICSYSISFIFVLVFYPVLSFFGDKPFNAFHPRVERFFMAIHVLRWLSFVNRIYLFRQVRRHLGRFGAREEDGNWDTLDTFHHHSVWLCCKFFRSPEANR